MKPIDEAKTVSPANVQLDAPSISPTPRTAMPPATPARPNHFGIFRARQAASDELTISAAAAADDGAANRGSSSRSAAPWSDDECRTAHHDDAAVEAVRIELVDEAAQAREEPEVGECRGREERRDRTFVAHAEQQRRQGERHVEVAECRQLRPRHAAKLQHRQ